MNIKRHIKKIISNKFSNNKIGFADLRGLSDNPLELIKRISGIPFIINVPIHKLRAPATHAFIPQQDSIHPFILTAREILKGKTEYEGSVLQKFYQLYQPKTAAENLGVEFVGEPYLDCHPLDFSFPWKEIPDLKNRIKKYQMLTKEYKEIGVNIKDNTGWKFFGPEYRDVGKTEFFRIEECLKSIKSNGYIRNNDKDGDIDGELLIDNDEWVLRIRTGQHRVCALAALGYEAVTIRISEKKKDHIYRNEVEKWPPVKEKYIKVETAIKIFDRIFMGVQPGELSKVWNK